jgi:phosphoribosyl-ATP pyrophosphohydrolase/phosphoribosyl-AMP cyclohydrolase
MEVNFDKNNGLVPAIIQDATTKQVLMLGYMNEASLQKTLDTQRVTFYSRSRQELWTKGETSGNYLNLVSIEPDCDQDTLLVQVNPTGPVCHLGTDSCWGEENKQQYGFLTQLEDIITDRIENPSEASYTSRLVRKGINKVAQKVGEEAVEVVIEAKDNDDNLFLNESADLLYHYLILLQAKGYKLQDVANVLEGRNH